MTVLLSNSLTRKLRSCWHYGKKPKTPFFMMWRKRTIGRSSTLGCRRRLPTYTRR